MMVRMHKTSLAIFVTLLSLTMVGEGMITVTLLWTSAGMGQSPIFIGVVLFIMNMVPFLAQILFKPMRRAIEQHPLGMIIMPRMIGCVAASLAGMTLDASGLITLIAIAACLTFISFISQQCIETLMGQLTVTGMLDAGTSARLSQTALQSGVFVGNALAGILIAKSGTGWVFFGIAVSFASSLLLLFAAPWVRMGRESPAQTGAGHAAMPAQRHVSERTLWLLLAGMALLAVQLSGFNFFVPLIFESRSGTSAADYGLVSAAAGCGALLATFVRFPLRGYIGHAACSAVVIGDALVTQPVGMVLTSVFAFAIGFGFNISRIRIRQAIFERLTTKQESALWAGRVTVAFRGVSAGAPMLFGLLLMGQVPVAQSWVFAAIGVLTMGVAIPACLLFSTRTPVWR
ncbi:MFS transporter [Verminephrobacter eiseniae]|uniref:hypothetical protein n=1 Tax=Verminephrobacter eiseniae TaxID=364317 RepID=UPI00223827F0|nr:hypothetical protein [Verminephrobacter eiseniae]MCW5235764.1 hypothetical protein [Verminephrobacter eiseniae]